MRILGKEQVSVWREEPGPLPAMDFPRLLCYLLGGSGFRRREEPSNGTVDVPACRAIPVGLQHVKD
jgi:hypothetical protein